MYGGNTPLHIAATDEDLDICKLFIEYGADVNAQNKNGDTPQSMNHENPDISDLFKKRK